MDAAEGSSSKGYRRELKLHERERKADDGIRRASII
jgi:hypothetical protein